MAAYSQYFQQLMQTKEPFHTRMPLDNLDKMLRRRNYREFLDCFKAVMSVVRVQNLVLFADGDQDYFTGLFELWFKALERPGFQLGEEDIILFLLNANITNLLAATPLRNGDACIKKVIQQSDNMAKLLLLYTPRSQLQIPIKPLFDANPLLASLWYTNYWNWSDTYISDVVQQNFEHILSHVDERLEPFDSDMACGFFRCTYVDNALDRNLKRGFCRAIRRYVGSAQIVNRPNPRSIAIVTAYWNGDHAVYRAFAPYVEELAKQYELTLINLKPGGKPAKKEFFKHVYDVAATTEKINISAISQNDFQLAYFPDVGMSQEGVYFANMRIAPIQCMGTGHPVTSCSPVMDYFMSGSEVETPDHAEENYDERLVLLPGLSVNPLRPKYTPKRPAIPDDFIINLPWSHMKNNHNITKVLRRIYDEAKRKVVFSVFPGCGVTQNSAYMATIQDFANILPQDAVLVQPDFDYQIYMYRQEFGRFTLHSYTFGGGTTAVDALAIRKPLVVLRGRHEYNRYPAALLTRLSLEELIADSVDQWVAICLRLIDDETYLADITRRVEELDLEEKLYKLNDPTHLRRAFDHLITHDAALRKDEVKTPILID